MSRIKIIQPVEATGRLKEIYTSLEQQRGQIAEVHKVQSLRPESIVKHMELYLEIMFSKSDLSRAQREMMAVVVSAANTCAYCAAHHGSALQNYWKNEEKVETLKQDFRNLNLSEEEKLLCAYAEKLTLNPGSSGKENVIQSLQQNGFSDAAILDATLVISYFNFVNRMVLSLGVELEQDAGKNYKY